MESPCEEPNEPRVVYEDAWLVAVRKPARMHSAPGLGAGDLCAWVFERYPEVRELGARPGGEKRGEGGLLHRLDYETSGLVLFARKAAAFASLLEQQARGEFYKEYIALSSPSRAGLPLGSVPIKGVPRGVQSRAWSEAREAQDAGGLAALLGEAISRGCGLDGSCGVGSAFRPYGPKGARVACLESSEAAPTDVYRSDILGCSTPSCALRAGEIEGVRLRVGLARGFRHQIRAQLAWIGLPIRGDPLYGGETDERLRLYAVRLSFAHPESGLAMSLSSEDE
jgi:23S rRNA pseudouridine1911/1915/1917 synthase